MQPSDDARYSMAIEGMGQQELDLLECLQRIDLGKELDSRAAELVNRLVAAGLVDDDNGMLTLTAAGIRRCQSLQHRQAGDAAAVRVLDEREHEQHHGLDAPD